MFIGPTSKKIRLGLCAGVDEILSDSICKLHVSISYSYKNRRLIYSPIQKIFFHIKTILKEDDVMLCIRF